MIPRRICQEGVRHEDVEGIFSFAWGMLGDRGDQRVLVVRSGPRRRTSRRMRPDNTSGLQY
jgi:hypothetical protein